MIVKKIKINTAIFYKVYETVEIYGRLNSEVHIKEETKLTIHQCDNVS